jgi:tetratricopeptide (TPR) repeat protein
MTAMRKDSVLSLVICVLLVAGCQSNKNKQEVVQRWAAARAAVQGSLASERYKLGNLDDARKAVNEAIKLDPMNVDYHILSARIDIERNQLDAADQELAIARKLAPHRPEPDYLGGIVYQRWQKANLALEYYTKACEKAPGELSYLMARAEMLIQLDRVSDAQQLLESKLSYFEYSGPLRDLLGTIYLQQGKSKEALDMLHQATVLSPDDMAIREHLARASFAAAQYREAMQSVNQILKVEAYQKRADLHMIRGECLLHLEQFAESRAALEKSLELNPSSVPCLLSLAKTSIRLNDLDRTQICVRRALAIEPENAEIHLVAGYVGMRQERYQEALASFEKAAGIDPQDPVALCMVGLVHEKMGQLDIAMQWYGRALQAKPGNPLANALMSRSK